MLNNEEVFAIWAPPEALWSDWAKPVLFAHLKPETATRGLAAESMPDVSWAPPADERVALILDLPGETAVACGVALIQHGYRPVPLFNGCPGSAEVVPTQSLMASLVPAADEIGSRELAPDAPPAFLLDARRMPRRGKVEPGKFDNRWMTFPQDYPSANLLKSQGIDRALIVQAEPGDAALDLQHILARWQEQGIALETCHVADGRRVPLDVKKPRRYRWLWYFALSLFGLYRSGAGGFGSVVPQPSSRTG